MNRNQLVLLLFVLLICLFSCGESETVKQEKLHLEIMAVHDAVMPKSADLNRLKRQLKSYKEIVSAENAGLKDSLINGILLLSKSDDMMTDWMANYDYPNDTLKSDVMFKYLTAQKDSIKMIEQSFNKSMAIAQGFLKNAPDSLKKNEVKTEMKHDNH
jgi:hypothetical protein